jgi:hypothetical protein
MGLFSYLRTWTDEYCEGVCRSKTIRFMDHHNGPNDLIHLSCALMLYDCVDKYPLIEDDVGFELF